MDLDRLPELERLLKPADLERCLSPLLELGFQGIAALRIIDREGRLFLDLRPAGAVERAASAAVESDGAAESESATDKAAAAWSDKVIRRGLRAGAERVGEVEYRIARGPGVAPTDGAAGDSDEAAVDALQAVVSSFVQSGFVVWVTSEMHLVSSQSAHDALEERNRELTRAVEHLRHLDQLKSNFLATVSHELRTPLTAIIGFSELLQQGIAGPLNPEQADYVQTIMGRADELLRLITQVLETSRLETGSVALSLEVVPVAALVAHAKDALGFAIRSHSAVILTSDLDAVPPVLADPDRVQQILVNLIGNALKFSRQPIEIWVRAELAPLRRPFQDEDMFGDEAADAIRFEIADNGAGLPADQLQRIFEPFYQVDASATREHGGAGLGLSIVEKLVTAHGGEVWCESEPGRGAAFFFTLPAARVPGA